MWGYASVTLVLCLIDLYSSPHTVQCYLNRILNSECWNEDGHDYITIFLHCAVFGHKKNDGKDKRNHLVVSEFLF